MLWVHVEVRLRLVHIAAVLVKAEQDAARYCEKLGLQRAVDERRVMQAEYGKLPDSLSWYTHTPVIVMQSVKLQAL